MNGFTTRQPILVVEQDVALRTSITHTLREEGYTVFALSDTALALDVLRENAFSLVLLDGEYLYHDGGDFCRQIRTCPQTTQLPIVLLLMRESQIAQIEHAGLAITDYLLKPLLWEEVRACVRTLLQSGRRGGKPKPVRAEHHLEVAAIKAEGPVFTCDELSLDAWQRRVSRRNQVIDLGRPLLFDLLLYFVRHRGMAVSRTQLLVHVWGYDGTAIEEKNAHTVSVHVHWLRERLEDDPEHPQLIQTVRGIGYRFNG